MGDLHYAGRRRSEPAKTRVAALRGLRLQYAVKVQRTFVICEHRNTPRAQEFPKQEKSKRGRAKGKNVCVVNCCK